MAFIPRNIRTTCYARKEYRQNFDSVLALSFMMAVKVINHNTNIGKKNENDMLAIHTILKVIYSIL